MTVQVALSLPPELMKKLEAATEVFRRVEENQKKIRTLHEDNQRLLAELAGAMKHELEESLTVPVQISQLAQCGG